jgi:hypothetical protein
MRDKRRSRPAARPPPVAEALVLGAVDRVGLGQNLPGDLVVVEVLVLRGVRVQLRAVDGEHRHADQTASVQSSSTSPNSAARAASWRWRNRAIVQ